MVTPLSAIVPAPAALKVTRQRTLQRLNHTETYNRQAGSFVGVATADIFVHRQRSARKSTLNLNEVRAPGKTRCAVRALFPGLSNICTRLRAPRARTPAGADAIAPPCAPS